MEKVLVINEELKELNELKNIPAKGLFFTSIGGIGEIGMNLYVYSSNGKMLLIDCGLGFVGDIIPSVEIIVPDVKFLEENKKNIEALVITHAHEDHIGAISYIWESLKCPIYATNFAAEMIEFKLDENGLLGKVPLFRVEIGSNTVLDSFEFEMVKITHSIPESCGIFIKTMGKKIFHTGDWKFDDDPIIGQVSDYKRLKEIGKQGLDVYVGDSTNASVLTHSKSEGELRDSFPDLLKGLTGKVAVTCFSSNVARIDTVMKSAAAVGRKICVVGRSILKVIGCAKLSGYLEDIPEIISEDEAYFLDSNQVLFLCTGSQGEYRSVLSKIARDEFKDFQLRKGDTVIFSSKTIPGNEKSVMAIQNKFSRRGVKLITDKDFFVHVSGHGGKCEIEQMYDMLKPKTAIPVHGESMHLVCHADIAESKGVKNIVMMENGNVLDLTQEKPELIGKIYTGAFALDGNRMIKFDSDVMKKRKRIAFEGNVMISIVVNKKSKLLVKPQVSSPDLLDPKDHLDIIQEIQGRIINNVNNIKEKTINDEILAQTVKSAAKKVIAEYLGKRPILTIHIARV